MAKQYLKNAYQLEGSEDTRRLYKDWAETYDEEITTNGYASPLRTATALVACGADVNAPLLDIGCGSGISGLFLRDAGFVELHGSDFSPPMLRLAELKEIYTELHLADLADPFEFVKSSLATVTAVGVMAPGHAQPDLIPQVMKLLRDGGLFGFSLNDHTLEDRGYFDQINRLIKRREVRVRWQEYGDHLPGIGLNSMIVVLQRTG